MKTFPSYVFAALGVALVVLGIAAIVFGEDAGDRLIGSLVAIIGVIQIIFGGLQRRLEDVEARTDAAQSTAPTPAGPEV